jgi:hypothetical protein
MTTYRPNASAADWNAWKQSGADKDMEITRVICEGVMGGKTVKLDVTEFFKAVVWPEAKKDAEL